MGIILTLGLLALLLAGLFLWRDDVQHERRRAEYLREQALPSEPFRCGAFILENGGTITMTWGSYIEEHTLDEDGELQIRAVAGVRPENI